MKIAITGARGFIGRHLTKRLVDLGHSVVPINRDDWDLISRTFPAALLDGCDAVVHLAAYVHVRGRQTDKAFVSAMHETNARGTEVLARVAAERGIKRFVFLSSAAVYGRGYGGRIIDEASPISPDTPYGQSKQAAEEVLRAISAETGLPIVSLRPPLVYGPGAPGNFRTLVRVAWRGLPVPSGALVAKRSFISVTNLCDLVACALTVERPARAAYVAGEPARSIGTVFGALCAAAGRKPLIVPMPRVVLRLALEVSGHGGLAGTLLDDFMMDASAARRELDWAPQDLLVDELQRAMAAMRPF